MGRTYRRGGNYNHNGYGKSLREKRQRGGSRKSTEYFDSYDSIDSKSTKKNKEFYSVEEDTDYNY